MLNQAPPIKDGLPSTTDLGADEIRNAYLLGLDKPNIGVI